MLQGITHVPYNSFVKLKESVNKDTAAVILEPVQGEGGVRVGDKDFFQEVRALCDSQGILFIMDEVQTGFGRNPAPFSPVSSLWSLISSVWPSPSPAAFPWVPCCARRR